jgi:hypothetical protein
MAEFSKQYDEAFGFGLNDFDYQEIFNTLENNHYQSQICEGLGTYAVAKSTEGKMLLAVDSQEDSDMFEWVSLEEAISRATDHS